MRIETREGFLDLHTFQAKGESTIMISKEELKSFLKSLGEGIECLKVEEHELKPLPLNPQTGIEDYLTIHEEGKEIKRLPGVERRLVKKTSKNNDGGQKK